MTNTTRHITWLRKNGYTIPAHNDRINGGWSMKWAHTCNKGVIEIKEALTAAGFIVTANTTPEIWVTNRYQNRDRIGGELRLHIKDAN